MLPFFLLLKDKRVESGSNIGKAQQLSLRKEKKGYFSKAATNALFPSRQPANPSSEASVSYFMEENLTVEWLKVEII